MIGMTTPCRETKERAARVLATAPARPPRKGGVTRGLPKQSAPFSVEAVGVVEKRLYAAAVVFHGNNTYAFQDTFPEVAGAMSGQMICYYARQLNTDDDVRAEVTRLLDERTDAKEQYAADKRRAAIGVLDKLNNIMRADHEAVAAAVVGKPIEAIDAMPEHLRGVVSDWAVRENKDGVMVVAGVKMRDPVKAAETMAKWVEMSQVAGKVGFSAESAPVDIMPEDTPRTAGTAQNGAKEGATRANGGETPVWEIE